MSRINPAWKLKPSWYLVAKEDKTIKPTWNACTSSRFDPQVVRSSLAAIKPKQPRMDTNERELREEKDEPRTDPRER